MGKRRFTTKKTRMGLYAAAQYLNKEAEEELGLQIPFHVYLQDPLVAENDPKYGFDEEFCVPWEPGIADGPTSSRFAVVDYNGDTGHIAPMAKWIEDKECFLDPTDAVLDKDNTESLQYHQVHAWAILQRALTFFEGGNGLGRRIPFGFEGNRLIVVPHAGYGKNAYYDRKSKSLQFYYFDSDDSRVYTCLSTDIVHHEFGHAVLDGVRPFLNESIQVETGAFHEFIGDLTAILLILQNKPFRHRLAETTGGDMAEAEHLANIAEQFGHATSGNPYLRTARNKQKMSYLSGSVGPHAMSEVLTGAMFDILLAFSKHFIENRGRTARQAFWDSIQRMRRSAIQPLDLLPPVDVTFKDYALAVLRLEELANPTDPYGYFDLMLEAFVNREILSVADAAELQEPRYLYDRLNLDIYHDIDNISRSRAAAYHFLDDNRDKLFIPANQDVIVADLYDSNKMTRQARRLPRQIILEYIWRESVLLDDEEFGQYNGEWTTLLCGGTLVFDERGNVLSWFRKPGTQGGNSKIWKNEIAEGVLRREKLLAELAKRIKANQVGAELGSSKGLLGTHVPPVIVHRENEVLRFKLSPHLHLSGEDHEFYKGGPKWEISS